MDKNCVRFISQLKNIQTLQNRLGNEIDAFSNERPLDRREVIEKLLPIFKIRGELKRELGLLFAEIYIGSENFFGPKEVVTALGVEIDREKIPKIGFCKAELKRARELGQFLILRIDETSDGQLLSMEKIIELKENKTRTGYLFNDVDFCCNENFFTDDYPKLTWALVERKAADDATDYLKQYEGIILYMETVVFKDQSLPKELQIAITEFNSQKEDIAAIIVSDWRTAATQLENLKITQLLRRTPVEILYDLVVTEDGKPNGKKLLPNAYDWSSKCFADGHLVALGKFDVNGAEVNGFVPQSKFRDLGICISRSSPSNKHAK